MKLGVIMSNLMIVDDFEGALQYGQDLGLEAVEVGGIGLWSDKFCPVHDLIKDQGEVDRWVDAFNRHGLEISALGGHGAPLTPNKTVAKTYSDGFKAQCKLAEMAGVKRMTLFAGLPEGAEGDTAPNWVTFAEWPYLRDTLEWQWEKRLLPYWREHGKIAEDHGVTLCFELHGGDMVHNPTALMRLREEIGPVACANFDFSHMWYQHIDPVEAIRFLGPIIQHVHLKDTLFYDHHMRVKGVFDSGTTEHPEERSWNYTIVGWGHGEEIWRECIITLYLTGYDHVLSLEMECEYLNVKEGLEKSVEFFKPIVLQEQPGEKWWEYVGMERSGGLDEDRGEG